jgi:Outer membrane protein beta-barrel domain
MKIKLLYLMLVGLLTGTYASVLAQDTVSVDLEGRGTVLIITKDREGLRRVREMDLNKILREATAGLDSTQNNTETVYEYEYDEDEDRLVIRNRHENTIVIKRDSGRRSERKTRRFWTVDFGLNNYLEDGKFPDNQGKNYGVSTTGSRYFAFGVHQRTRIGSIRSPFSFQMGLELSWYNFMFQRNTYIDATETGVVFKDYEDEFQKKLDKSKLVVSYLNIPLMINMRFRDRDGRRNFNLGAGGYFGYRIGSYSKQKIGREPNRERDNFFLNNWRYGLEFQAGYREILLFFKYDLNTLFADDISPKLNAFAFGIRI